MFFYEGSATIHGDTTFTSNTADNEGGETVYMARQASTGSIAVESIFGLSGLVTLVNVVGMEL